MSGNVFLATCENVRMSVLFRFVSSHTAEAKQQEERQCALLKRVHEP